MEERLVNYLVEKYRPTAVLIHGSRASNNDRAHSDWDFALIVKEDIESEREIIDEANIEIRVLKLPFDEEHIGDRWLVLREGNVKVLFDPEDITQPIIKKVTEFYNKPFEWTTSEIIGHSAWYRSHIDGLIDYQNEQESFFRKLGELYLRSIQYWFWFLRYTYMPQVYDSLPRIEKEDPEYFQLIKILASNASNQEKISAAGEIYKRIWK